MKLLPTLFKPLCTQQPKTSSFRIMTMKDDIYKTLNSMYFNPETDWVETPKSWFTNSLEYSESPWSSSTTTDFEELVDHNDQSHVEAIVRGAQQSSSNNQRLFFDPGESDSPRLQTRKLENELFKRSVAMLVDSKHPYNDFKKSMEEMVESLGVRDDWEGLEELLRWYLKVNDKETHNHIINAFVDLVGDVISYNNNSGNNHNHNYCSTSGSNDDDEEDHRKISKSATSFSSAASTLSSLGSNLLDHMIY